MGKILNFWILALAISASAANAAVTDPSGCSSAFWRQMAKEIGSKAQDPSHPMTLEKAKKLQPLIVSNQYLENVLLQSCEIQNIKKLFARRGYEKFCPQTKSKLKVECFKDWMKSQDISYAVLIPLLDGVATSLANRDKHSGADKTIATLLMIDADLIPIERLSTSKNVAFTPIVITPSMRETANEYHWTNHPESIMLAEKQRLQTAEKQLFSQVKERVLPGLESQLEKIRASKSRQRASYSPAQAWVQNAINSLDERIQKIKSRDI